MKNLNRAKRINKINSKSLIEVTADGTFYLCGDSFKIPIAHQTSGFNFSDYENKFTNFRKAAEWESGNDAGIIKTALWNNGDFENPFTSDDIEDIYKNPINVLS